MSQPENTTQGPGPAMPSEVFEVQGRFPTDAAMQDAMARLALLGFDRADFSVPSPEELNTTADTAAGTPDTTIDSTQLRTMNSGMTGAAVGMAAAALLATGGAAAPVVVAGAGLSAIGASAAATGVGLAGDQAAQSERDRLGAAGKLMLAVRIHRPEQADPAVAAMRDAGATEATAVTRVDEAHTRGVSASSWTG